MTNTDVVKKMIGNINPVGETNTDNERFENLKAMCLLIDNLILDVIAVIHNKSSYEYSVKRAGEYADGYIKTLKHIQ